MPGLGDGAADAALRGSQAKQLGDGSSTFISIALRLSHCLLSAAAGRDAASWRSTVGSRGTTLWLQPDARCEHAFEQPLFWQLPVPSAIAVRRRAASLPPRPRGVAAVFAAIAAALAATAADATQK